MQLIFSDISILVDELPVRESNRVFYIPVNVNYCICITNFSKHWLEYQLCLDGKIIGTWRLSPLQKIILDRPIDKSKKFFFTSQNSIEILCDKPYIGMLVIDEFLCRDTFKSAQATPFSDNVESDSPGVTVLKGSSSQKFRECIPIKRERIARFFIDMEIDQAIEIL